MKHFKALAAMSENRVIGNNQRIPWHLPEDFKWFKKMTTGQIIVMGRKTFESIGKPLPGRLNIVISHSDRNSEGVTWVHSLREAFERTRDLPEVMVIGGASIYEQALASAERLYLTYIDHVFMADTFFPPFSETEWICCETTLRPRDEANLYDLTFCRYEKNKKSV